MKNTIKNTCAWIAYVLGTLYFLGAAIGYASTGNTLGLYLNILAVISIFIFAVTREISRCMNMIPIKADTVDHLLRQLTNICQKTGYTDEMAKRYPDFVEYLNHHGFIQPNSTAD